MALDGRVAETNLRFERCRIVFRDRSKIEDWVADKPFRSAVRKEVYPDARLQRVIASQKGHGAATNVIAETKSILLEVLISILTTDS